MTEVDCDVTADLDKLADMISGLSLYCHACGCRLKLSTRLKLLGSGLYGRVVGGDFKCTCDSSSSLAIKITLNVDVSERARNEHELSMWREAEGVDGVLPLLHSDCFGDHYFFVSPQMRPLQWLRDKNLSKNKIINLASDLAKILCALTSKGLAWVDGGCKQLLLKDDKLFLCDLGGLEKSKNESTTAASLALTLWELRMEFSTDPCDDLLSAETFANQSELQKAIDEILKH